MAKGKVVNSLSHDGVAYKKGDTFEGGKKLVDQLITAGVLRDPNAAVEPDNADEVRAADREAQEILDNADKTLADAKNEAKTMIGDAEKTLADAKAEAEKIVGDAEAQAANVAEATKAAQSDADKIVADAKAEAEKIRKAAQAK